MKTRRLTQSRATAIGVFGATALAGALALSAFGRKPASGETEPQSKRPSIEAVFVLDTTGSMGRLIAGAKEKTWAIANSLATSKPTPNIKMGLVGYRDRGDAYVTKQTQLTDDLDAVYADLMDFQARSGGDTPESVNQALHEAVTAMKWSTDETTYRVIFLVGDCPPHMDYADDIKYPESCKLAAESGIVINTIQCGNHRETEPIWSEIARKAEGKYFRIDQSGGVVAATTPFDAELAELARALDGTRVYYGNKAMRARQAVKEADSREIADRASLSAQAQRATFNAGPAGKDNFAGPQELLTDLRDGRVKLSDVPEAELPEKMRKMTPAERKAFVDQQAKRRHEVAAKIRALSSKRQAHLDEQRGEQNLKGDSSFDAAVFAALKEQAAKRGMVLGGKQAQ